jgi:hypothetical protein
MKSISAAVEGPVRNLTYAMLDALGRTIVTGGYEGGVSRRRRFLPLSTPSAAR